MSYSKTRTLLQFKLEALSGALVIELNRYILTEGNLNKKHRITPGNTKLRKSDKFDSFY